MTSQCHVTSRPEESHLKWEVIVALRFQFNRRVAWATNIWCVFRVRTPFSNLYDVVTNLRVYFKIITAEGTNENLWPQPPYKCHWVFSHKWYSFSLLFFSFMKCFNFTSNVTLNWSSFRATTGLSCERSSSWTCRRPYWANKKINNKLACSQPITMEKFFTHKLSPVKTQLRENREVARSG